MNQPLVIDPVMAYSTYLGSTDTDRGYAITFEQHVATRQVFQLRVHGEHVATPNQDALRHRRSSFYGESLRWRTAHCLDLESVEVENEGAVKRHGVLGSQTRLSRVMAGTYNPSTTR